MLTGALRDVPDSGSFNSPWEQDAIILPKVPSPLFCMKGDLIICRETPTRLSIGKDCHCEVAPFRKEPPSMCAGATSV